jgi:hypothetical protein
MSGQGYSAVVVVEQAGLEGLGVHDLELAGLESAPPLDRHLATLPRSVHRGFGFASLIAR